MERVKDTEDRAVVLIAAQDREAQAVNAAPEGDREWVEGKADLAVTEEEGVLISRVLNSLRK